MRLFYRVFLIVVGILLLYGCKSETQKGWYIRLNVETDRFKDNGTIFGYLKGADDGQDKYDSKALSANGLYTTIYHEDFGNIKNYRSDYRAYAKTGDKTDIWIVKVRSNDPHADVTLSWNGITYLMENRRGELYEEHHDESLELQNMKIIDELTGESVSAADNDMQITFNMQGNYEYTFKWMLVQTTEESDTEVIKKPSRSRLTREQ